MFIKYLFLIFILFSLNLKAENPYLFQPDFSGSSFFIPQGTNIMPLCADPSSPACFSQWTHQAVPLANYFPNASSPQYNYFAPSFIPIGLAENPEQDDNWEEFYLPSSSARKRRRSRSSRRSNKDSSKSSKAKNYDVEEIVKNKDVHPSDSETKTELMEDSQPDSAQDTSELTRKFYKSKSDPKKIRIVETDEKGNEKVQEGKVVFVNVEDVQTVLIEEDKSSESKQEAETPPGPTVSPTDPSQKTESAPGPTVLPTDLPRQTKSATSPIVLPTTPPQQETTSEEPSGKAHDESGQKATTEQSQSTSDEQQKVVFQISQDTQALQATTKEVKPGCVIINKQDQETEAGFCAECVRNPEDNTVLNSLVENSGFLEAMKNYLNKVASSTKNKINQQTVGSSDNIEKICSPEISLKAVINNFNKTCSANFKDFFKKAHCKSCQKGIPVELMMAMMSIESAGNCPATANNQLEQSAGLFQIDNKQHQCIDSSGITYKVKTRANLQCLKNPVNNLSKSIDILVDHYGKVNPTKPVSAGQCKDWTNMKSKERDSWRRGVSAYNGGPGWVTRAIKSAKDKKTLSNTGYLTGTHKTRNAIEKSDRANWEELRLFYFIEKLSPGNSGNGQLPACKSFLDRDHGGTGRQLCLTVSNLAHTEAVLGREITGSMGIIEVWSQYKSKFLKNHPVSCSK